MAYVSPEMKAKLSPNIKAICKKYGIKATLAVRNHMTLVLNIKQGEIDFIENLIKTDAEKHYGQPMDESRVKYLREQKYLDVNTSWAHEHFSGKAKQFLTEMISAMKGPDFFDHTDAQTDYFHCSHYVDIKIGKWDKPYALVK